MIPQCVAVVADGVAAVGEGNMSNKSSEEDDFEVGGRQDRNENGL